MQLYDYFRSSAAFRVRIALNIKNIKFEHIPIHLLQEGGDQFKPEFLNINPQGLVPVLRDGEQLISQTMAIIEYLEEIFPTNPILPQLPPARARVRSLSNIIACDIHPLNNLRVLKYITGTLGHSDAEKNAWYYHWLHLGFKALETLLINHPDTGKCCHGDTPTMADIFLVPQYYNAKRFDFPMVNFLKIQEIAEYCLTIPAFYEALPEQQQQLDTTYSNGSSGLSGLSYD